MCGFLLYQSYVMTLLLIKKEITEFQINLMDFTKAILDEETKVKEEFSCFLVGGIVSLSMMGLGIWKVVEIVIWFL